MKLWRATGKQEYFDLAKFFIDSRGSRFFADERKVPKDKFDGTYWLDDVPIREHKEIKGHAVRAAYLLSGAADLASVTGDQALRESLDQVWRNTVFKRVFVTGGIGPSASNEGFTVDYDLPNMSAYPGNLRVSRDGAVESPHGADGGRREVLGLGRASTVQRIPLRRVPQGDRFFLCEPARQQRRPSPLGVVRMRLLPAQRDADSGQPRQLRVCRSRPMPSM